MTLNLLPTSPEPSRFPARGVAAGIERALACVRPPGTPGPDASRAIDRLDSPARTRPRRAKPLIRLASRGEGGRHGREPGIAAGAASSVPADFHVRSLRVVRPTVERGRPGGLA